MAAVKLPCSISYLATCAPPSSARAWQTAPHPYLPLIATAASDKTVRVYSLRNFSLLSTVTGGHKRSVRAVTWKPGLRNDRESVLATGSFDATAGIWRGENSKPRIGGHAAIEPEALLQTNGVATTEAANEDEEEDYAFAVVLEGHDSEIKSLAFSHSGTYLATCSRDKSLWIWEALPDDDDNFETVAVLQEHDGDVKTLAWHPTEESCLATGSYDDMARIWREDADGEWSCVGVCEGHAGTVWCVAWEPSVSSQSHQDGDAEASHNVKPDDYDSNAISGPRIMTSSDDLSIRLWRRKPKAPPALPTGPRIPSIIRSSSDEEEWYEDGQLPQRHERSVYSIAWSPVSGRVASAGGDGRIVVYEQTTKNGDGDVAMSNGATENETKETWTVIGELEAAHGVYEVNHICWATRQDSARRSETEEILITTGDDGEVRVWTIDA